MSRVGVLRLAAALLLWAVLVSLVPGRAVASTATRIIVPARTEVAAGEYGEVVATLQTASGSTIAGERLTMTLVDDVRQRRTDASGSTYFRIRNDLAIGTYVMAFNFPGTSELSPSSVQATLVISRPVVSIQTVPTLEGVPFELGDETALTDVDGVARIPYTPPRPIERPTPGDLELSDRQVARFSRWYGSAASRLTATYSFYYQIRFSFSDLAGHPVDRSLVTGMTIKNSVGERFELTDEQQIWFQGSRVVPLSNGLESKEIYYTVESVTVNGSNVVNRSQQKFIPSETVDWDIHLLFYSAAVSVHDALFRFPTGTAILLEYPDGHDVKLPLVDGRLSLPSLPRGNYRISVVGPGLGIPRPLALSRNQDVTLELISYLDVAVVGLAALALAFGLFQIGRPHVVPGAIGGGGRAVRRLLRLPERVSPEPAPSARAGASAGEEPVIRARATVPIGAAPSKPLVESNRRVVEALTMPALRAPAPGMLPRWPLVPTAPAAPEWHAGADRPRRSESGHEASRPTDVPAVTAALPKTKKTKRKAASRRTELPKADRRSATTSRATAPSPARRGGKKSTSATSTGTTGRATTVKPKPALVAKIAEKPIAAEKPPRISSTKATKRVPVMKVSNTLSTTGAAGAKANGKAPTTTKAGGHRRASGRTGKAKTPAATTRPSRRDDVPAEAANEGTAQNPRGTTVIPDDPVPEIRRLSLDSLGIDDPGEAPIKEGGLVPRAEGGDPPGGEVVSCRGCGLPVWVGASFCRRCGHVVGELEPAEPPSSAAPAEAPVQKVRGAARGRKRRHAGGAKAHRWAKRAKR